MKLVQFATTGADSRAGVIRDQIVLDLGSLLAESQGVRLAGPQWPAAVNVVHAAPDLVRRALAWRDGDRYAVGRLDELTGLLPAFSADGGRKVVCTGANFRDHRRETEITTNTDMPDDRVFGFLKAPSALCAHRSDIIRTDDVEELDFEVELAVVFGATVGAGSSDAELSRSIAGFTVFNDVSDRALQRAEMGAGLLCGAKNRPGYGPLGPALVTPDEVGDPDSLDIAMVVNGETRQQASTVNMIFSVQALVAYWSRLLTFAPGDVLTLGTPSGSAVSAPLGERRFLQPGDVMEARIERVGSLVNQVTAG